MDHNGIILDKNPSRHPGAQLVFSATVWFMQNGLFFFLERAFFCCCCYSLSEWPSQGWRNPLLSVSMTFRRRPFKHPVGSSRILSLNSEAETWAGQGEWRKPEAASSCCCSHDWRVVSRERQSFAEIKMAGSRDLNSERFIILNVLFFSYLAAVCSTAQVPVLIWTTER